MFILASYLFFFDDCYDFCPMLFPLFSKNLFVYYTPIQHEEINNLIISAATVKSFFLQKATIFPDLGFFHIAILSCWK